MDSKIEKADEKMQKIISEKTNKNKMMIKKLA